LDHEVSERARRERKTLCGSEADVIHPSTSYHSSRSHTHLIEITREKLLEATEIVGWHQERLAPGKSGKSWVAPKGRTKGEAKGEAPKGRA
jgi:hypothetical protein